MCFEGEKTGAGLTINQPGEPTIHDPNHRAQNNASEVWSLVDAVGISGFIQEDTCYNLTDWVTLEIG